MLLHLLDQHESFQSLTYRDMPFVLAPNLWRLLHRHSRREGDVTERAHGDGILVGYDSPESFEEVFWRTFSTCGQINGACYGSEDVSAAALEAFSDYRALVVNPSASLPPKRGKHKRYLSKNNNNLLRLRYLALDPTATILLVYRNPIDTARSLHRLHLRFCAEAGDGFAQKYMEWLGHHEFGPGHLPFSFARVHMNPALSPNDPNYWLDYWNAVYLHVLEQEGIRLKLVNHDLICQSPKLMLDAIFLTLSEVADTYSLAANVRPQAERVNPPIEFMPELVLTAQRTHARLLKHQNNISISL